MADEVRIRCGELGDRADMPKLKHEEVINGVKYGAELGFRTDEDALYIGTADGNVRLCGADDLRVINLKLEQITARLAALETPSE